VKLQVDVNVENETAARLALDDVEWKLELGEDKGDVKVDGQSVGRFELLVPVEPLAH
jgi:hypothetical protein